MYNDIPGPNPLPKFYGEIPGVKVPGDEIPFQVKADSLEKVLNLCELVSGGMQYFYIVEAYPDLRRGDPQAMPSAVDVIRLSLYHIDGALDFPPPVTTTQNFVTDCPSIEDFVLNYRNPAKFQKEEQPYKWAIMYGHYHDILTKGYTHVSRHDNVTGQFLTYVPEPFIFQKIAMQFKDTGLIRSKFEVSERVLNFENKARKRLPNSTTIKVKR
ncbi:hypothetical protein WJU16_03150 [Chitinophaga pollutisoli]|uniref:Uncharacterized protein n=1 Tax=Chitinophaga pollutisoli TaxID=3133966 RepID=A0ABZ2YRB3_9BACT